MGQVRCKMRLVPMSGETKRKILRGIKLTQEENELLKREAHQHEMNVSEYIRYLIKKERERKGRD